MKSFVLALAVLCTVSWSNAYSTYHRSSSTTSSSTTSSGNLSPWAYANIDAVRQVADRLREDYNARSRGRGYSARYSNHAWDDSVVNSIGKSKEELDSLCRQISDQIISDMQLGRVSYGVVAQPNYFESQAATALEKLVEGSDYVDNQQQQVELYEPIAPQFGGADLSKFDQVQHVNYPTEVKVVNGQTYITNKNFTTGVIHGSFNNPGVTTVRVNRTTTHTTVPLYVSQGSVISRPFVNNREHSIYNHLNKQEIGVPNYSPEVTVDDSLVVGMNQHAYTPSVVIPVEGGDQVEAFGNVNQYLLPGHTVTIRKYNRTIITGPDGRPIVTGSKSESVWDNGILVYNSNAPFGSVQWTKDDLWKREERERLFWLFQNGVITIRELEEWQRNQEDRLSALAYRSNKTLEEIQEWQRQELERYKVLVNQYNIVNSDLTEWQKSERGRLDWLIHQNGITREDLERWQRENLQKLNILARQYHISIEELKEYQRQELERLYVIFNNQNTQISGNLMDFQRQERDRLNNILLQHNTTVDQLKEQIRHDQDRYKDLSQQYRLNVEDLEKFYKSELSRLTDVINKQQEEMKRITDWQQSERSRLENIIRHHNFTVEELEQKMKHDRNYLTGLAQKYHISLEDLERWQRSELDRLHEVGKVNLQKELQVWQQQERDRMLAIIKKNDLTIEEYESKIGNDRARLQQLASMYQVQVEEIEKWLKEEAQRLKNEGVFSDVQKNLTLWQKQERDRLQAIVQNNELTIEDLQNKIKNDQTRLYGLAQTYQIRVEEIEDWLKKELLRLQSQGLVKKEDLEEWQKTERQKLLVFVQDNKLSVEDFEKLLLKDRNRLQQLATQYHVELKDIESWLRKESDRLQSLGLIEQEKLTEWQKVERERLLALLHKNELSIDELEKKIKSDHVHLYSLAHQYSVRVEEIEEWLKKEVLRLQNQALIDAANLKDWQKIERERLMKLVNHNDLTIDEFTQKLKADRAYLQQLAMQHHVEIEEVEEWVKNEGNRLEILGLIKPNAPLTEWQEVERDHLLSIVQEQGQGQNGHDQWTLDELEERLKNDRAHLSGVAQQYKVQVQEIEEWIRKELQRLQNQGLVQIEQLNTWQLAERERLNALIAQQQSGSSVDEIEKKLRADRNRLQDLAFQNNVHVKEIEEWIHKELERMKNQGQLQIENLTDWQQKERDRLLVLVQQQSDLTVAELEQKLQNDRSRLQGLAYQYHVEVKEVEEWIRKEIQRLRDQGKLHIENLTAWQLGERDRLQHLIQQQSHLSVQEVENQLKADRNRLQQLALQYHIQLEEVEEWIRKEAQRLRNQGELHIGNLTDWQKNERLRIQQLILQNSDLTAEEFENQLKADSNRLQQLAWQHHVQVADIEAWIKQEVQRLRDEGKLEIEKLAAWQKTERDRLLQLAKQQSKLTLAEFEEKLINDRKRLEALAIQYHVSVQEIEDWIKKEAERLENQGIIGDLKDWQRVERLRIQDLIKQNNLTNEDLKEQLKKDHNRLQQLALQYHVTVEEVEEWILKEGNRQIKPEALTVWQTNELQRIQQQINQQPGLTIEQWEEQLKSDRNRLQQLAWQYHVTVNDVEEWIRKEGQKWIKPESLTLWQLNERERLRQEIKQRPDLTIADWEQEIRDDRSRLQQLAWNYQTTIEEIEEWIRNEGRRVIKPQPLNEWQKTERQWILQQIQQPHGLTIDELEAQLKSNRYRLQQVAQQYHVAIEEIEEWIRKEGNRLIKPIQLNEWQKNEHDRLLQIVQHNDLTIEELRQQLKADRARLQQLAYQYHVTVEEVEEWIVNEGKKLIKPTQLTEWQQNERDRLLLLINQNDLTIEELKQKLQADHARLQQLAQQYHVTVDEVEEWIVNEGKKLIKPVQLTVWQQNERDRYLPLIKKNDLTIEELKRRLQADRARLQQLANQYHVTVEEIEEWIVNEGRKIMKPVLLTEWQQSEQGRLILLMEQNNLTIEGLRQILNADRSRLQQLANQYHVTVEEVEEWIVNEFRRLNPVMWQQNERERLHFLIDQNQNLTIEELKQKLQADRARLQQLAYQYHITVEEIEEWIINEGRKLINPVHNGDLKQWQQHEREYLVALTQTNLVTLKNFEKHLSQDQQRLENVANHYQISVDEIIQFLHQEVQRLARLKLISEGEDEIEEVTQWQNGEQQHIQQLLLESNWSIEELERKLRDDRAHLQQLADQYRITIDQVEEWYRIELQKLLQQKKIYSENLTDWQKREKERIYLTIKQQQISIEELEQQLARDRDALRRLAAQYHITIEELIEWQRKELGRLNNLDLVKKPAYDNLNAWQILEKKRLRAIPVKVTITMDELANFLASDVQFQGNLTSHYEVSLEELKAFQLQELQNMKDEGVLEILTLKHLQDWQRRELDRLYGLIRQQNFALKDLKNWQRRDRLTTIASIYRIPADTIKNWQYQEMKRLEEIAKHYKITLNHLEDFRRGEIKRLEFAAHQGALTESEIQNWIAAEEARLNALRARTGLSGPKLDKWRRKLYLLSQDLIDLGFNEGGYGGIELETNTSASGKRNDTISKDRGDQPPQLYQEEFDESEPSIGSPSDHNAPMVQVPERPGHGHHGRWSHRHGPPHEGHGHGYGPRHYLPPQPGPPGPPYGRRPPHHGYDERTESERVHRKKEYSFTVPVDVPAPEPTPTHSDYGYQNRYSHGRGPFSGKMLVNAQQQNDQEDDLGQQQVQVEDWNSYSDTQKSEKIEDLGQQQQIELGLGQQVQNENLQVDQLAGGSSSSSSSHSSSSASSQSSSQIDGQAAQETIVNAESVTEQPKSVWGKIKTSAKSWFG